MQESVGHHRKAFYEIKTDDNTATAASSVEHKNVFRLLHFRHENDGEDDAPPTK